MSISVPILRGSLTWLDEEAPWPSWAPPVVPERWLEATLPARRGASSGARRLAYRSLCQTASSGSFVVLLGATFTPGEGEELRVRVAVSDEPGSIEPWLAEPMFDEIRARLAGGDLAAGTFSLDRGVVHEVDTQFPRHRRGAGELAQLLCAHRWHDEATLRAAVEVVQGAGANAPG